MGLCACRDGWTSSSLYIVPLYTTEQSAEISISKKHVYENAHCAQLYCKLVHCRTKVMHSTKCSFPIQ